MGFGTGKEIKGGGEMTESKELVVSGNKGLTLASLGDMYKFAQYAIASQKGTQDGGWIPQCYKTPEQVVMAVQCGAETLLNCPIG